MPLVYDEEKINFKHRSERCERSKTQYGAETEDDEEHLKEEEDCAMQRGMAVETASRRYWIRVP